MAGKHISLLVHFVWSTANREPWITSTWENDLFSYIGGILRKKKGKLLEAGGVTDHIHLFTSLPSTMSIAEVVNTVKANSSRWIHEEFVIEEDLPGRKDMARLASADQRSVRL